MNKTLTTILASLMLTSGAAWAANDQAATPTDGEVRKIDLEAKKLTLKHAEIKNLNMPGMTMVFQVKDPATLATLKAGDQVRFRADKVNGAYVVTDIEPRR